MLWRKHPDCEAHLHAFLDHDTDGTGFVVRENELSCDRCLLLHILERLHKMPTQADFDAAIAALSTAIDAEFTDLSSTITDETAKIVAALAGQGIPQSAIDSVNALGARIATAVAASKTAVQAELPAA